MATTRPRFDNPPLAEQAITVIFDRLPQFSLVDFGLLWGRFQSEFPRTVTQPMREPVVERFDEQVEQAPMFRLMPEDAVPRAIFRSATGHEQVQVQPDLFTFNWLKVGDEAYPNSEPLIRRFAELFVRFAEYVAERKMGAIRITHCELANVNIVPVSDFGSDFGDVGSFFEVPKLSLDVDRVGLESCQFQAQYVLYDDNGRPIGRLRQALVPVSRIEDDQKAYRFELTARGTPDSGNLCDSLSFFDKGRDAINATFVAATTSAAHAHWGLK
ncbi:TIGR04255 family protein [Sphingomonas sp. NCPPB 2930]